MLGKIASFFPCVMSPNTFPCGISCFYALDVLHRKKFSFSKIKEHPNWYSVDMSHPIGGHSETFKSYTFHKSFRIKQKYMNKTYSPIYTIWAKVCRHLTIILICACWTSNLKVFCLFAALTSSNLLGRLSTRIEWIEHGCGNGCPFSHKSISEVGHWCQVKMLAAQFEFHFLPKVFNRVEVRALCRPLKF